MYPLLHANFISKAPLTADEFALIEAVVKPVKLKKKTKLLTNGEVCRFSVFVNKGCLRSYSTDKKGEHIVQFAFENNWIGDLYSYITETASHLTIEAIEDCELLYMYKKDMEQLYRQIPFMERIMRLQFQNAYVAVQRRLNATLSITAEERYIALLAAQPDITQRVPLLHIASYLGIAPESLSRIRKQLFTR